MATTDTPTRDAVLVKYLNEAFGKEKQLETNLQALIARAQNHKTLKKGFQDHLKVTKNQSRELQKRIKALGGKAEAGPDLPGPDAVTEVGSRVTEVANRALAAAKGPVQMLRGTGEADNMLRNVRDAYWNEAEEIAHYDVIEAVATKLNDRETVQLAKRFRREEERMQKFLGRQITALAGEVIRQEVPAKERRANGTRRRTGGASRSRSSSSGNGAAAGSGSRSASSSRSGSPSRSASSSRSANGSRSSAKRSRSAQKGAATRARKSASSSAKSTAKSARTTAKKAGTTAKKAGRAARSTTKAAAR